jgi:hypothetical protein
MNSKRKQVEATRPHIIWENNKSEKMNDSSSSCKVIPFRQRKTDNREVTHQHVSVETNQQPIKIVSSGFGNIKTKLGNNIRSCAA